MMHNAAGGVREVIHALDVWMQPCASHKRGMLASEHGVRSRDGALLTLRM